MKVDGVLYCDLCDGSITGDAWRRVGQKIVCSECMKSLNISDNKAQGAAGASGPGVNPGASGRALLRLPHLPQSIKAQEASATERGFSVLGTLWTVLGALAGLVSGFFVSDRNIAVTLLGGLAGALAGFLVGMWYFAIALTLRYLRQILNELRK